MLSASLKIRRSHCGSNVQIKFEISKPRTACAIFVSRRAKKRDVDRRPLGTRTVLNKDAQVRFRVFDTRKKTSDVDRRPLGTRTFPVFDRARVCKTIQAFGQVTIEEMERGAE